MEPSEIEISKTYATIWGTSATHARRTVRRLLKFAVRAKQVHWERLLAAHCAIPDRLEVADHLCGLLEQDTQAPLEAKTWAAVLKGVIAQMRSDDMRAVGHWTWVLSQPHVSPNQRVASLAYRALANQRLGFLEASVADHTAVLQDSCATWQQVAAVRAFRAQIFMIHGRTDEAMSDANCVIEEHPYLPQITALAHRTRSGILLDRGEWRGAIADATMVLKDFSAAPRDRADAAYTRACACMQTEAFRKAIRDFSFFLKSEQAPRELRPVVLLLRSHCYRSIGKPRLVIVDMTSLLEEPSAKATHLLEAYVERGSARVDVGEYESAIQDFDSALGVDAGVPVRRQFIHLHKAVAYAMWGKLPHALDYFNRIIDGPVPHDTLYWDACLGRASLHEQMGRADLARNDWQLVVNSPEVSPEQKRKADNALARTKGSGVFDAR